MHARSPQSIVHSSGQIESRVEHVALLLDFQVLSDYSVDFYLPTSDASEAFM